MLPGGTGGSETLRCYHVWRGNSRGLAVFARAHMMALPLPASRIPRQQTWITRQAEQRMRWPNRHRFPEDKTRLSHDGRCTRRPTSHSALCHDPDGATAGQKADGREHAQPEPAADTRTRLEDERGVGGGDNKRPGQE